MAQGQLMRLEVNNTTVSGPQGQLMRLAVSQAGGDQGQLHRLALVLEPTVGDQGKLHRLAVRVPVSANAGPDQAGVEPYTAVSLQGSDSGGVTTTRVWVQVSGPAVVLTQAGTAASFVAPGVAVPTDLVFGYTAGDSTQDTVKVTVLAATEQAIKGGQAVPIQFLSVKF
jgi:hypothetical protein